MKVYIALLIVFMMGSQSYSKTIVVDLNGSGNYTSIAIAVNLAQDGDTVKVLPGTYAEQINITKAIVLMGSGYENTKITSSSDPTVTINSGKIMWFSITSTGGSGILFNAGIVTNCVIQSCAKNGIEMKRDDYAISGSISNCVLFGNGGYGVYQSNATGDIYIQNSISYNNGKEGFWSDSHFLYVNYCNGSTHNTNGNIGNLTVNPSFVSNYNFHLSLISQCINAGNNALEDPDGTRSDMGYFGGIDCPIYPVVTDIQIIPLSNGQVQIQATARANY